MPRQRAEKCSGVVGQGECGCKSTGGRSGVEENVTMRWFEWAGELDSYVAAVRPSLLPIWGKKNVRTAPRTDGVSYWMAESVRTARSRKMSVVWAVAELRWGQPVLWPALSSWNMAQLASQVASTISFLRFLPQDGPPKESTVAPPVGLGVSIGDVHKTE